MNRFCLMSIVPEKFCRFGIFVFFVNLLAVFWITSQR